MNFVLFTAFLLLHDLSQKKCTNKPKLRSTLAFLNKTLK